MRFPSSSVSLAACVLFVILPSACHPNGATDSSADTSRDSLESISAGAIEAHIGFLADDLLEGRGTGSRGYDIAAKYVEAQLSGSGIRGGAESGSYFQRVPFVRTSVAPGDAQLLIDDVPLDLESDYILLDTHREETNEIAGDVVFLGYGVTAPDLGHDDYEGIDVNGDIVALVEFEAPASFPSTIRAYYADQNVKIANAVSHGAAGVIFIRSAAGEQIFPWEFWLRELDIGWNSLRWLDNEGVPGGMPMESSVVGVLNHSGSRVLFDGEEHEFDELLAAMEQGEPPVFALNKTMSIQYEAEHRPLDSPNVIGYIEGADPELKHEYLVYTAHLDHLGIGPPLDGDAIFNGALDNASGCAVLLEIADAFAMLDEPPKRSILFIFVTGEEEGLLGADYFVQHPTVAIENVIANINIDGGIALAPVSSVVPYGAEHSSLGPQSSSIADELGVAIESDPFPEEGYFVRSDQLPFVLQGIPSVFLGVGVGFRGPDGGDRPLEAFKEWSATRYHTQKDDLSQAFDYESAEMLARFAFLLGQSIANEPDRPQWNQGDFFGTRFGGQ